MFLVVSNLLFANSKQEEQVFTFTFKDESLKRVFREIENSSDYRFMYNDALINVSQKVSIDVKGETISKILESLLGASEISYEILDKQIILNNKQKETGTNSKQNNTISLKGKVLDNNNESLPGVTIVVKGTTQGTTTDIDGNFSFTTTESPGILVFSFIGFQSEEISYEGNQTFEIILRPDLQDIEEVVVIGYGTSSKKLLTGSVGSLKEEEIQESTGTGIETVLQGKVTGVQVVQNSGTPGGAISLKIRGSASLSSGTQPLYVIDGIPMNTGNFGQVNFEGQGIDASTDLNPGDIESISILKDASAAAIYGARAANGVILITTKKGKAGESSISFSGYTGIQKEWKRLEMLNAREWREYVETFDPGFVNSLDPSIDTDWQDEVFRVAPINNYELSFSGGKEKTTVYASVGYFNQEGIILGADYSKYSGRLNIDHSLSEKLKFGSRIGTSYSINNRIVGDQTINGVLPNAISKPPVYAVRDEMGNYLEEGFWDNPVAIGNEVTNESRTYRNLVSMDVSYQFNTDFSAKYTGGVDFYNLHERRYEPTTVRRGAQSNGIAIDARSNVMRITNQLTLNYSKAFGKHTLSALAGASVEKFDAWYTWMRGSNFPSDELQYINEAGTKEETSSSKSEEKINSLFGRINYNFNNKYIAEFSLRRDGSSIFGPNNKFAYLPSFSVAYRLIEEPFIKKIEAIDELKLKIGYGLIGNDQIGRNQYANLYSGGYNYVGMPGLVPKQIPNPNLKWETSKNFNIGLDLGMYNRIFLGMEFYRNNTVDLLMQRPIPGSSGFGFFMDNVGNLINQGFEFSLNGTIVNKALVWNSSVNLSFNRNKITKMYNGQPILDQGRGNNAAIEGQPIGVFFMYRSLGVDPSTGDIVFEDLNHDEAITDEDRQIVGDPNPDFTGGFINKLAYKGFDLNVFFQFSYGNQIFNGTRQYAEAMKFGTSDNQLATIKDRWQKPGDITYIPRHDGINNLFPVSSKYIEDGSYLRLKEITLGYNFPKRIVDNLRNISKIRLYLKSQNLLTFTNYSGLDPEVNYAGKTNIVQGTDFFTYPIPRSFIFGFNLEF